MLATAVAIVLAARAQARLATNVRISSNLEDPEPREAEGAVLDVLRESL